MRKLKSVKKFTIEDQLEFSIFSGDRNPIHVDKLKARRLISGEIVVHGVSLVLWAIDSLIYNYGFSENIKIKNLKVLFSKPTNINQEIYLYVKDIKKNNFVIYLKNADLINLSTVKVEFENKKILEEKILFENSDPPFEDILNLKINELNNLSGSEKLYLNLNRIKKIYPFLDRFLDKNQVSFLLGITRIVGCKCPGMNSLISEFNISFNEIFDSNTINYKVKEIDKRFNLINLRVDVNGSEAYLKVFYRPSEKSQLNIKEYKNLVIPFEFSNRNSLIIGASRGLGEVIAKLLALGGSNLYLTYNMGKKDCINVVNQIKKYNKNIQFLQFDIKNKLSLNNLIENLSDLTELDIYYFPTPKIISSSNNFSESLFNEYCFFYEHSLFEIIKNFKDNIKISLFNPSTIFIDNNEMQFKEYVKAKLLSEKKCLFMQNKKFFLNLYQPRLISMKSDQTSTFLGDYEQPEPSIILVEELRKFYKIINKES